MTMLPSVEVFQAHDGRGSLVSGDAWWLLPMLSMCTRVLPSGAQVFRVQALVSRGLSDDGALGVLARAA